MWWHLGGKKTYLLTEQSPTWEANRFSASQEIPRILWNPNVHYRIHKFPPPVPILSPTDPVHTPTSHSLNIHFNIILPSTPGSTMWSLSLRFPHQNPTYASPILSSIRAIWPAHPLLPDFVYRTIFGEQYGSLSSWFCSFVPSTVISFLLGPNILNTHPQKPSKEETFIGNITTMDCVVELSLLILE